MPGGMLRAMATVHTTIMISVSVPTPNEATQMSGSGHSMASDSGETPITAPIATTNSIGRRGTRRMATRPPATRPTDSAAVIAPHAAGPPRSVLATTGPSTWNAPYQAIITTQYWPTIAHSQVCDRNSVQPSRMSASTLVPVSRTGAVARMASSSGTVVTTPAPQVARAQPGPTAATTTPATAEPAICAAFIASRLIALPCWRSSPGATAGSRACDAG